MLLLFFELSDILHMFNSRPVKFTNYSVYSFVEY